MATLNPAHVWPFGSTRWTWCNPPSSWTPKMRCTLQTVAATRSLTETWNANRCCGSGWKDCLGVIIGVNGYFERGFAGCIWVALAWPVLSDGRRLELALYPPWATWCSVDVRIPVTDTGRTRLALNGPMMPIHKTCRRTLGQPAIVRPSSPRNDTFRHRTGFHNSALRIPTLLSRLG